MNGNRTCIICLPRTGSQLCEKLTSEVSHAYILGEFFENWNSSEYVIDINKISIKNTVMIPSGFKIAEDFETRIALLKKVDLNQPLTLRIFLMDHYDKNVLSRLVLDLKNIGFEFLTLHRDTKDQLLSYLIANTYFYSKNINVFGINNSILKPVTINLTKVKIPINQIHTSSINWETNLSKILNGIEYQKVNYETIYSDMESIYNTKFKYQGEKSIKGDPFDLIINREEVIDFLTNL
jgi:hypothetical protein